MANRDEHLRNHGILIGPDGLWLASAYDMDPAPEKPEHAIRIDSQTATPDLSKAIGTRIFTASPRHKPIKSSPKCAGPSQLGAKQHRPLAQTAQKSCSCSPLSTVIDDEWCSVFNFRLEQ